MLASGCADVNVQKKVGDFGTAFGATADEQKAIDWFKATYGDPTTNNDKPARFVEPLITSGLSDRKMPVDKVTTFPVSGGSVYFFVIYDNFKDGDPIEVSWTYIENGREVTSVKQQAGGDFGRFIVEFQKPDTGWGPGKQRITITGDGATASVDFGIGDALQTIPLPYNPVAGEEVGRGDGQTGIVPEAPAVSPISPMALTPASTIPATRKDLRAITPTPIKKSASMFCIQGLTMCGDKCIDLQSSVNNCGMCGNTCNLANAESSCSKGKCVISKCSHRVPETSDPTPPYYLTDFGNCDSNPLNGCEADLGIDAKNCYSCGNVCPDNKPICYCGECFSKEERSSILPDSTVLVNGIHYPFICKISDHP